MKIAISLIGFLTMTFIISAQEVGINKTNPEYSLDVRATNNDAPAQLNVSNQDKSRYLRIYSGSSIYPDPSITIAPERSLLFASFDDISLVFTEYMRISSNGNVGIGVSDPDAKLEINGQLKITDGNEGVNKVLVSDANGLASWAIPPPPVTVKYYESVNICCNSWMTKNLDVDVYRNGDTIPKVENSAQWDTLTIGAYCYYNNDSTTYASIYGKLYNWHAVNDPRGLAPEGWHLPTDFEWTTTIDCLGGASIAGGPMKEIGITHWISPNTDATNLSGFTGLPGGFRYDNGSFYSLISSLGGWWSSTEGDAVSIAWSRSLNYNFGNVSKNLSNKGSGLSVRCLRN